MRRAPLSFVLAAVFALLTLPAPRSLHAQQASPYLPLDHWAYPVLDAWIARGDIADLSPFTRPLRAADVARALEQLATARLSPVEEALRQRLLAELGVPALASEPDRDDPLAYLEVGLEVGGRLVTQTHPDPLQPVLDGRFGETRALERIDFRATGSSRYVAGSVRLRRDGIFRHDPRFPDGRVTFRRDGVIVDDIGVRLEDAYVEFQVPLFRLGFGRLDRNWGPTAGDGFLRSPNAYSQDELFYRFGTDRVFLIGTIGAPTDFAGDTTRYVSMHRLEVRASDRLVFAVGESVVYGGPDGRFQFGLTNPIGIWQIALDEGEVPQNNLGQVDAWWRAADGVALNASLLADATNREGSCCQLGASFGATLAELLPDVLLRARATFIQSLAYRTELPWEAYSVEQVGLGWDKADLVLGSLRADWFVAEDLRLSPGFEIQVRGEGDFRKLRPDADQLPDFPRLLVGETETTIRPAVRGRWTRSGRFRIDVEWDAGVSFISGYGHSPGDDRTELTGHVAVRVAPPGWGISLR